MSKKKYENGLSDKEIMEMYKKDKHEGITKMVEKYSDYIYYIIRKHYPSFTNEIADMYQNGVIGIINAMNAYNPEVAAFSTYCTPYIKKEISRHVRFMASESSEYFAAVHNSVERAKTKIEAAGNDVTIDNVMDETGLSKKIVKREMNIDRTKVSYETLENVMSTMSLSEQFMIDDMLSGISKEQSDIIKMKVFEGMSFVSIAKQTGRTTCSVKNDYNAGIATLRDKMTA